MYREIEILNLLRHPNIIRLYEVIDTPEEIYFVMEYAEKGDLFNYISDKGSLQEEEARKIFQQVRFTNIFSFLQLVDTLIFKAC